MLLRLCQLKTLIQIAFILMIVSACSWRSGRDQTPEELVSSFPNKWFSLNPNHSLVDSKGEPVPHVMFDTTPEFREKERFVNTIIATPRNSEHNYQIDLNSGQRYYTHSFCKQSDVWSKYNGNINRPSFSIGYIPRVLDQLGEPQKIIVWSNRGNYGKSNDANYFKVKIVGAYVEQICPEGNCIGKSNWLSRLVFVGLDAADTSMPAVTNVADFQKTINWEESKAELENIEGRNFIGDNTYPAVRVGQLIDYGEAFDYFKKRSIFMNDQELKKIQKGCHSLYQGLWDEVGKWRPEEIPAKTKEELSAKLKLREELKKKRLPVGFAARLRIFTKKYYQEISTCERFVYHGNINKDPESFWFLSYMGIYFKLHREGYHFNCQTKSWQRNILNRDGKLTYDLKEDIEYCSDRDIDLAMDYLPNFLSGLKGEKEFYKFIDYDGHSFGTHKKMYSWVKMKNRRFECSKDPNQNIKKESRIFPEDVSWKNRDVKDIADDMKIIY